MMMVALMKNKMKKSTVSARSLWKGDGMLYSRPVGGRVKMKTMYWASLNITHLCNELCNVLHFALRPFTRQWIMRPGSTAPHRTDSLIFALIFPKALWHK